MELNELRAEIDSVNQEMLALFQRRMTLSRQVAEYKEAHGMEIFVPAREVAILNNVRQAASPELADYAVEFFNAVMQISREYQGQVIGRPDSALPVPTGLRTERLLLQPLSRDAAPPIYSLTSDPEVARYMRFGVHTHITQAEAWIEELTSGPNLSYLVLQPNGLFVGVLALRPREDDLKTIDLTVCLGQPHWNQGYCGELLEAAANLARDFLSASCLEAYVADGNIASRKAFEKAGFAVEERFPRPEKEGEVLVYRKNLV